jgi:hypothetical protein
MLCVSRTVGQFGEFRSMACRAQGSSILKGNGPFNSEDLVLQRFVVFERRDRNLQKISFCNVGVRPLPPTAMQETRFCESIMRSTQIDPISDRAEICISEVVGLCACF